MIKNDFFYVSILFLFLFWCHFNLFNFCSNSFCLHFFLNTAHSHWWSINKRSLGQNGYSIYLLCKKARSSILYTYFISLPPSEVTAEKCYSIFFTHAQCAFDSCIYLFLSTVIQKGFFFILIIPDTTPRIHHILFYVRLPKYSFHDILYVLPFYYRILLVCVNVILKWSLIFFRK